MGSSIGTTAHLLDAPAAPEASAVESRPASLLHYAERDVQPPGQLYVGLNDLIQIRTFGHPVSNELLTVDIRLLLPDGQIQIQQESVICSNNFSIGTISFRMAEGFLLSVAVRTVNANIRGGQIFAMISLIRQIAAAGNIQLELPLSRGYVTVFSPCTWPSLPVHFPTSKPGNLQTLQIANPAAGAEFTVTVPTNARWRFCCVRGTLVTAVAAANRSAILNFNNAGNVFYNACAAPVQAASLTWGYSWGAGVTTLLVTVGSTTPNVETSIPVDLWLPGGSTVQSITQNIQAADQWTAIFANIEECPDN